MFHPESWNSNANVFFVDQPVGVGFSYAEYGEHVVSHIFRRPSFVYSMAAQDTSEDAAKDIAAFVAIFFENFSSFKGRAFHMAGESYGVSLLPGPWILYPLTGQKTHIRVVTFRFLLHKSMIRMRCWLPQASPPSIWCPSSLVCLWGVETSIAQD